MSDMNHRETACGVTERESRLHHNPKHFHVREFTEHTLPRFAHSCVA